MCEISSVILAGGKSKRFGKNKAFLKVGNKILINLIVDKTRKLSDELIIVTNTPEKFYYLNVKLTKDIIKNKGPLGGIYTGLYIAKNKSILVIACDMPFLNTPLIKHIISYSQEYDVVIPKIDKFLEPIHAIYSKQCLKPIKRLLDTNNLKIIDFFSDVNVKFVKNKEIKRYDPKFLSFFNINTLSDLKKANEITKEISV